MSQKKETEGSNGEVHNPSSKVQNNPPDARELVPPPAAFAQAAAFGEAVAEGAGADDIYLWEHGVAVKPWPEPVNGKALLDTLEQVFGRFAVLPKWAAVALALWVVHTYAWLLRHVATYIGVESPEKRCGKTTLLTVLCELVNRPVVASNISSPAFFRVIEEKKPTLMIDEADTVLHRSKELKGILNSGCTRKTGYVIRMRPRRVQNHGITAQEDHEDPHPSSPRSAGLRNGESGLELGRFSSYCPKAIALIKHLPDTLADRCILIRMQRKSPEDKCERVRDLDGEELRRQCARFVQDHAEEIATARPDFPEDLNDRAADIWEPLLAVADLAGGDWPEKARAAAVGMTAVAQEESPTATLLLDLLMIFARQGCLADNQWMKEHGGVRMFSRDIVAELNAVADRPWMVLRRGKAVTERWLSQQLSPYGVRPRTLWIGEDSAKGYMEDDLAETFRRYIPKSMGRAFVEELRAARAAKPSLPPKPAPPAPAPIAPSPGPNLPALNEQLKLLKQAAARAKQAGHGSNQQ